MGRLGVKKRFQEFQLKLFGFEDETLAKSYFFQLTNPVSNTIFCYKFGGIKNVPQEQLEEAIESVKNMIKEIIKGPGGAYFSIDQGDGDVIYFSAELLRSNIVKIFSVEE